MLFGVGADFGVGEAIVKVLPTSPTVRSTNQPVIDVADDPTNLKYLSKFIPTRLLGKNAVHSCLQFEVQVMHY